MKISLLSSILQLDGTPFKEVSTLQEVCFTAITTPYKGVESLSIEKKMELYRLAQRISSTKNEVEFSAEEIVTLKTHISAVFGSVVVIGQALDLLDPPSGK